MPSRNKILYPAQLGLRNYGILQVHVVSISRAYPIENATVQIFRKEDLTRVIAILTTDISGRTTEVELITPPLEYSQEPTQYVPYAEYVIMVTADGFRPVFIDSAQVLPYVKSIQPVRMSPSTSEREAMQVIMVDANFLDGSYTPKVYEDEIKSLPDGEEPVVIPRFITVHDSIPSNITARNYTVEYVGFIKNVVSSMIYATWPQETIYANILVVLSFSLNRVYTNWYRRQGYDFDITSAAAFDNLWFYGRNIFTNISLAVDTIFNNYLSRPGIIQPILTQTCSGELAICPGMMSLWESKYLGDRGYRAIDILHYFYGNTLYINSSNEIIGVEVLWPGTDLSVGSSGEDIRYMQNQLSTISEVYRAIPLPEDDGTYGQATEAAVREFQEIFNLPATGIVNAATWYKINRVYGRITEA